VNRRAITALALACALTLPGCAWTRAATRVARDGGITGLCAVLGWVLGAPAGPVVQGVLVFFGAAGGKAVSDSIAMSTGEIQGEEAAVKEAERLRATLLNLGVRMQGVELELGATLDKAAKLEETKGALERALDSTWTWTKRLALAGLAAYLLGAWRWWRNAARWNKARKPLLAAWSVLHALLRFVPVPPLAPVPRRGT
jgi:hypothetical protein